MKRNFKLSFYSIISIFLCISMLLSVPISSNAQTLISSLDENDYIEIENNKSVSEDFNFKLLANQNNYAIIELTSQDDYPYTFEISKKGEKTPCPSEGNLYLLEIGEKYPFVYTYTKQNTNYIYNGTLTVVELSNGELRLRISDKAINQVLVQDPLVSSVAYAQANSSRAAGTMYEIESNDYFRTADVTYDDYDNYGFLSSEEDEDWWEIQFDEDGTANFWLGNIPSGCDYDIELYTEAGALIFTPLAESDNAGTNAELIQYNVRAGRIYYIRIFSADGWSTRDYLFRAKNYLSSDPYEDNNSIEDAYPLDMPASISAKIDTDSDEDYYRIFVEEAGTITVELTNVPSTVDYDLYLYDYSHDEIEYSEQGDCGEDEYISADVVITGAYYIGVIPYAYTHSNETYDLDIYFTPDDSNEPDPPITPDLPEIPDDTIGIQVLDTNDEPIQDAVVYVYRQKDTSTMYPFDPLITGTDGTAICEDLNANATYAVNVIANDYEARSFSTYLTPSDEYYTITLNPISNTTFNDPVSNFSPIQQWGHNGYNAQVDVCDEMCDDFIRICPHEYMNVEFPQNFGWRYGTDSTIEFHQAIDISGDIGEDIYNIFNETVSVNIAGEFDNCGNVIQLYSENLGLYATYMHLNQIDVFGISTVAAGASIGELGNTGTTGAHLHLSVATSSAFAVGRINASSTEVWNQDQIECFIDPLKYMN